MKWTKDSINKLVLELKQGKSECEDLGDDAAFDIADGILKENVGLEKAIKQYFNVTDVQGWLANRI